MDEMDAAYSDSREEHKTTGFAADWLYSIYHKKGDTIYGR
jgi:hypothetical protein